MFVGDTGYSKDFLTIQEKLKLITMANIPKILIINLEKSTNRKKFMSIQLDKLNLKYEFLKGTYGKTLPKSELKRFNTFQTFKHMGRDLHPNEKGCYLSHYYAWKKIVDDIYQVTLKRDVIGTTTRCPNSDPYFLNISLN